MIYTRTTHSIFFGW